MTDTIIEAAARALESLDDDSCGLDDCADWYQDKLRQQATAVIAAGTPMIRAAALEEAARVADEEYRLQISLTEPTAAFTAEAIADRIRALKVS